jgi:hypothetical protein
LFNNITFSEQLTHLISHSQQIVTKINQAPPVRFVRSPAGPPLHRLKMEITFPRVHPGHPENVSICACIRLIPGAQWNVKTVGVLLERVTSQREDTLKGSKYV